MAVSLSRIEISRGSLSFFEATPDAGEVRGTVLMVPGYTGSREDFLPLAPFVTAAGYRLIAYSQLGQYDSDGPDGEGLESEYTVEKFGADVLEVLDKAAPGEKVHLLGHSFGGIVTRNALLRQPSRFLDYVILDSPPAGAGTGMDLTPMIELIRSGGNEAMWQAMFGTLQEAFPAPVKEFLHNRILKTRTANLLGIGLSMTAEPDRVAQVAGSGVPAIVVAGENDFVPLDAQRDAAERIGCEFVVIPGASHTPNEEKPGELTAVLAPFWDKHQG